MREIVPAIMPHTMNRFREMAQDVSRFASSAQLDIGDGDFISMITWPFDMDDPMTLEEFPVPSLLWEAHLMIREPGPLGEAFARIGVERIVGHIEAFGAVDDDATVNNARRALQAWRAAGAREVGISLVLDTPMSAVEPLIQDGSVSYVQVMGIAQIGAQGHPFDARTIERVRELHAQYPQLTITVDGGVNNDNARALVEAGATRLAAGSSIWNNDDHAAAFRELMQQVREEE
jgi:ribulose-phosphate 3-epimerase